MKQGLVIDENGTKKWYINGHLHRTDGPAVEYPNGTKTWYVNGEFHRTDGPAVEWPNGNKQWFLNDEQFSEEEWRKKIRKMKLQKILN